jgi:CTP synthase
MLKVISEKLTLENGSLKWLNWKSIARSFYTYEGSLKIAIVGKYVSLPDSYVSVYHALSHAAASIGRKVEVDWIESEKFEKPTSSSGLHNLRNYDGILAPGGFGKRGSEGIVSAANFARIENIPYLGICFGFQLAIVAVLRNLCFIENANSTELDPDTKNPVIEYLPEQRSTSELGGTMRLGNHEINIMPKTMALDIYGNNRIFRRHRHRYEFNQKYKDELLSKGVALSAFSDNGKRLEIFEIPNHRFYFASQYHSEFSSRPGKPEEAFVRFVKAASIKS